MTEIYTTEVDNHVVHLGVPDYEVAVRVGIAQQKRAERRGYSDKWNKDRKARSFDEGAIAHIIGAAGEIAFCRWYGVEYEPRMNGFKGPDVGTNIQVRTRRNRNDLFIRPLDANKHIYVLALVDGFRDFYLAGWIVGADGKKPKWFHPDSGHEGSCYFVPIRALNLMDDLRKLHGGSDGTRTN